MGAQAADHWIHRNFNASCIYRSALLESEDEAPLPPGRDAVISRTNGETYYHATATGATSWERPTTAAAAAIARKRLRF